MGASATFAVPTTVAGSEESGAPDKRPLFSLVGKGVPNHALDLVGHARSRRSDRLDCNDCHHQDETSLSARRPGARTRHSPALAAPMLFRVMADLSFDAENYAEACESLALHLAYLSEAASRDNAIEVGEELEFDGHLTIGEVVRQ